jgi:hypothetical protein
MQFFSGRAPEELTAKGKAADDANVFSNLFMISRFYNYLNPVQKGFLNNEPHKKTWRGLIARNPHGLYTDFTRTGHGQQIGRISRIGRIGRIK